MAGEAVQERELVPLQGQEYGIYVHDKTIDPAALVCEENEPDTVERGQNPPLTENELFVIGIDPVVLLVKLPQLVSAENTSSVIVDPSTKRENSLP